MHAHKRELFFTDKRTRAGHRDHPLSTVREVCRSEK